MQLLFISIICKKEKRKKNYIMLNRWIPDINTSERLSSLWYCLRLFPADVSGMLKWGCSAALTILWKILLKSPSFVLRGIGASIPMSWLTYLISQHYQHLKEPRLKKQIEFYNCMARTVFVDSLLRWTCEIQTHNRIKEKKTNALKNLKGKISISETFPI